MGSLVACESTNLQNDNSNVSKATAESADDNNPISSLNETELALFNSCGATIIELSSKNGYEYRISSAGYVAETGAGYAELVSKESGTTTEVILTIENNKVSRTTTFQEFNELAKEMTPDEMTELFGGEQALDYPLSSESITKLNEVLAYSFDVKDLVDYYKEESIKEKYQW